MAGAVKGSWLQGELKRRRAALAERVRTQAFFATQFHQIFDEVQRVLCENITYDFSWGKYRIENEGYGEGDGRKPQWKLSVEDRIFFVDRGQSWKWALSKFTPTGDLVAPDTRDHEKVIQVLNDLLRPDDAESESEG